MDKIYLVYKSADLRDTSTQALPLRAFVNQDVARWYVENLTSNRGLPGTWKPSPKGIYLGRYVICAVDIDSSETIPDIDESSSVPDFKEAERIRRWNSSTIDQYPAL